MGEFNSLVDIRISHHSITKQDDRPSVVVVVVVAIVVVLVVVVVVKFRKQEPLQDRSLYSNKLNHSTNNILAGPESFVSRHKHMGYENLW